MTREEMKVLSAQFVNDLSKENAMKLRSLLNTCDSDNACAAFLHALSASLKTSKEL